MNSSCQKKRNATNEERIALVTFLSWRHKNGCLNKGAIDAATEYFPFKRSQIKVIWRLARTSGLYDQKERKFGPKTQVQSRKFDDSHSIYAIITA